MSYSFRLSALELKRKTYSQHKVRTNLQDRTLDSMFPITSHSNQSALPSELSAPSPANTLSKGREIKESECFLTSVKNLRKSVIKGKHRRQYICPFSIGQEQPTNQNFFSSFSQN